MIPTHYLNALVMHIYVAASFAALGSWYAIATGALAGYFLAAGVREMP